MIGVIGLGFVGLTTALGLSDRSYQVFGYDCNDQKMDLLKNGSIPFHEPFLTDALNRTLNKSFFLSPDYKVVVQNCSILIVCVGTPNADDGCVDLAPLFSALDGILNECHGQNFKTIVIKSTVPPGTCSEAILPFIQSRGFICGKDIGLANNPEFLREGFAWEDFTVPDRIVIGTEDENVALQLSDIYSVFNAPLFHVSLNTAEFIKYLSNTLLATLISFSNEMAMIANATGNIDIRKAFRILHQDKRWFGTPAQMTSYAYPGCGFGGYCLPKDSQALLSQAQKRGVAASLLQAVLTVNAEIKKSIAKEIMSRVSKLDTIGILGLAFKPETDDVRESPAKDIVAMLIAEGYVNILAYDPLASDNFRREFGLPIQYADNRHEVFLRAECIVILTAWNEFRNSKIECVKPVIDCRYFTHTVSEKENS